MVTKDKWRKIIYSSNPRNNTNLDNTKETSLSKLITLEASQKSYYSSFSSSLMICTCFSRLFIFLSLSCTLFLHFILSSSITFYPFFAPFFFLIFLWICANNIFFICMVNLTCKEFIPSNIYLLIAYNSIYTYVIYL